MHLFDDKLSDEKNKKSIAKNEQMFASMNKGGLDMLFSSAVATESKKEELPMDLQYFVDTISGRVPQLQPSLITV